MNAEKIPRLRMFAGPNGSGKTSLVHTLAREFSSSGLFNARFFINADDIARELTQHGSVSLGFPTETETIRRYLIQSGRLPESHLFITACRIHEGRLLAEPRFSDPYVAATIADFIRESLFALRQSFTFETVMSHRSKVDFFAKAGTSGYRTYLYFIATDRPEVNLDRVAERVELGGHHVPREKVIARYHRSLELAGEAASLAYRAFFYDNSTTQPKWIAERTPQGQWLLKVEPSAIPAWFATHLPEALRDANP